MNTTDTTNLISIGLPVFNGESYLRESVESILAQDHLLELIISDNASTDGTSDICRHFASRDSRVRYFRYEENKGAAWNYNNCFALSKGKYFKWAAYDDKIMPSFCAECLEVLESDSNIALAYCRAEMIDSTGIFIRYDSDHLNLSEDRASRRFAHYFQAYKGHNICNPVFGVFRSNALRQTRLIGNFLASDRILLGEISLYGKIIEIPKPLFIFRWHEKNSMNGYDATNRLLWFDPNNRGKLYLGGFVWTKNWLDAVKKARLPLIERVLCRTAVYRWIMANFTQLAKEVIKWALWPLLRRTVYRGRDMGY